MEDVVDAGALWQTPAVGDCADAFQHLKGSGVLGTKLAAGARDQGLRVTVKHAQQHPVPNRELQSAVVGVVEAASMFLRLKKTGAYLSQELVAVG